MYKRYELCIPSLNYCSTNQITPSISEHENFQPVRIHLQLLKIGFFNQWECTFNQWKCHVPHINKTTRKYVSYKTQMRTVITIIKHIALSSSSSSHVGKTLSSSSSSFNTLSSTLSSSAVMSSLYSLFLFHVRCIFHCCRRFQFHQS